MVLFTLENENSPEDSSQTFVQIMEDLEEAADSPSDNVTLDGSLFDRLNSRNNNDNASIDQLELQV